MISKWIHSLKQISLHLVGWFLFYGLLYSLRNKDNLETENLYSFLISCVTSAVSSYLLFLGFRLFFEQRKYKYFLIVLIGQLLIFSLINQIIINLYDKISFLSSFVSFLFVNMFAAAFYFAKNGIIKQIQVQELNAKQLEAEMKLLKAQVNPHFLFNTLNNLYGLILQNQTQQAAEITLKLSDLMRYLLESSKTEKVSLKREVQFIHDYLALEKIRLAHQTAIKFETSGLEHDVLIAPLLFVPLIENAFKHGLQSISDDSFAHFSLAVQGNEVFFESQNSIGKMLDNQEQSGTGLVNLRKRLILVYPEKHFFEVEQTTNVFKVIFQISL